MSFSLSLLVSSFLTLINIYFSSLVTLEGFSPYGATAVSGVEPPFGDLSSRELLECIGVISGIVVAIPVDEIYPSCLCKCLIHFGTELLTNFLVEKQSLAVRWDAPKIVEKFVRFCGEF